MRTEPSAPTVAKRSVEVLLNAISYTSLSWAISCIVACPRYRASHLSINNPFALLSYLNIPDGACGVDRTCANDLRILFVPIK